VSFELAITFNKGLLILLKDLFGSQEKGLRVGREWLSRSEPKGMTGKSEPLKDIE